MKELKTLTSAIILGLYIWPLALKGQLKIDAQYRPRFEFRDGYQKLASEGSVPAVFISQRTRITFSYENDLILNYKFLDWGALEGGYLFFLPTNTLRTIQNVQNDKFSQFFYLQLTITPDLFKQKQSESL